MNIESGYCAKQISKSFSGDVKVLNNVNFTVQPGKVHALFGHNGAGKSTLLKILAGAQPHDEGVLSVDGQEVSLASPREALGCGISCVYQELRLVPNLSVAENLYLGREIQQSGRRDVQAMNDAAQKAMHEHGLDVDVSVPIKTLSHPYKQMVEVIANLESNVRYLFLDEPTTALDAHQSKQLLDTVRKIAIDRQVGVVLVSHKLDEVLPVCDEVTVLSDGKVVLHSDREHLNKQEIISAIVGESTSVEVKQAVRGAEGETFLETRNLSGKNFSGINVDANRGEVLGIFGLVGSGRTEFLNALFGNDDSTSGEITLDGRSYRPESVRAALAAGVAMLTEERKHDGYIPLMNAYTNVVLPTLKKFRKYGLVSHNAAQISASKILKSIGTRGNLDAPISTLSGGNQQKALFARVIEQNADLVLLDEPTKGVDIGAKNEIYNIIRNLAEESRCVIVVSSEEEELMEVSDKITVFHDGRCVLSPQPLETLDIATLRRAAWGSS